jgi:hypothetical protein
MIKLTIGLRLLQEESHPYITACDQDNFDAELDVTSRSKKETNRPIATLALIAFDNPKSTQKLTIQQSNHHKTAAM